MKADFYDLKSYFQALEEPVFCAFDLQQPVEPEQSSVKFPQNPRLWPEVDVLLAMSSPPCVPKLEDFDGDRSKYDKAFLKYKKLEENYNTNKERVEYNQKKIESYNKKLAHAEKEQKKHDKLYKSSFEQYKKDLEFYEFKEREYLENINTAKEVFDCCLGHFKNSVDDFWPTFNSFFSVEDQQGMQEALAYLINHLNPLEYRAEVIEKFDSRRSDNGRLVLAQSVCVFSKTFLGNKRYNWDIVRPLINARCQLKRILFENEKSVDMIKSIFSKISKVDQKTFSFYKKFLLDNPALEECISHLDQQHMGSRCSPVFFSYKFEIGQSDETPSKSSNEITHP